MGCSKESTQKNAYSNKYLYFKRINTSNEQPRIQKRKNKNEAQSQHKGRITKMNKITF